MFIIFLKMSIDKALDKQKKIEKRIRAIQASIDAMQDNIHNNETILQRFKSQLGAPCEADGDCDFVNGRIKQLEGVIKSQKEKLMKSEKDLEEANKQLDSAKAAVVKASIGNKLKL